MVRKLLRSLFSSASAPARRRHDERRRLTGAGESLESRRLLTEFVVTTRFDLSDPNDGVLSLREALAAANDETANPGHDTITFADDMDFAFIHADYSHFELQPEPGNPTNQVLTGIFNPDSNGQFEITSDVTIDASAAGFVRIGHERGFAQRHRIFDVAVGTTVVFDSVFIQGGDSNDTDGDSSSEGDGAGIRNAGDLTLKNSAIGGNFGLGTSGFIRGGGIFNEVSGTVTLNNSHIGEIALNDGFLTELGFTESRFEEGEEEERNQFTTFVFRGESVARLGKATDQPTLLTGNGAHGDGGGIYNEGTLHVTNGSTIRANVTGGFSARGAGVYNAGIMFVSDSSVSDQKLQVNNDGEAYGTQHGGAIYNAAGAELTIERSDINGNQSLNHGGAIVSFGTLVISESTLDDNTATDEFPNQNQTTRGGAIYLGGGTAGILRSTISNSSADFGGGIYQVDSELLLDRTTVANNSALDGGGVHIGNAAGLFTADQSTFARNTGTTSSGGIFTRGPVSLADSIVAANSAPSQPDLRTVADGIISSGHYNLLQDISGVTFAHGSPDLTDITGQDARLGELAGFGGGTKTVALLPDSPAIDAGRFSTSADTDQRGTTRVIAYASDIGAYEAEPPAMMRVDTLDDISDGFYGQGQFSLREAIEFANHIPGPNEIGFDEAFIASLGDAGGADPWHAITLASGQLRITDDLVIRGPGADLIAVDGNDLSRVFHIAAGTEVTIADITVTGGNESGTQTGSSGGGIFNSGDLTLLRSRVTRNATRSFAGGGGIYSTGSLVVDSSTIDGNSASVGRGGGFRAAGPLYMKNSTVSGNLGWIGGGGGWLASTGVKHIENSTITENDAGAAAQDFGNGGGLYLENSAATLKNTIVAANRAGSAGDDLFQQGTGLVSAGYNLIGIEPILGGPYVPAAGDQVGTAASGAIDPLLGRLAYLGGGTPVHGILPGSPALETADPAAFPRFDQRGVARPIDVNPDSGSFEYEAPVFTTDTIVVDSLDGFADGLFTSGNMSLTEAVLFAADDPSITTIVFDATMFEGVGWSDPKVTQFDGRTFEGLQIDRSISIIGPGADKLVIDAGGNSRLFTIGLNNNFANVSVSGLTLAGGGSAAAGGALINYGILTLDDVYVRDSTAAGGGALLNFGNLTVTNSTFANNTATGPVGGGAVSNPGTAYFTNVTFSGNSATGDAAAGGGGVLTQPGGFTDLLHVTLTGNSASVGGGIDGRSGSTTRMANIIVSGNTAASGNPDVVSADGSVISRGGNVIRNGSGSGVTYFPSDRSGLPLMTDLVYSTQATTPVHMLLPTRSGNRALNAGINRGVTTDQRGVARGEANGFSSGATDLGVVDSEHFTWDSVLVVDRYDDTLDGIYGPGQLTFREAVILANVFDADNPVIVDGVAHDVIRFCSGLHESLLQSELSGEPQRLTLTRGAVRLERSVIVDPFYGETDYDVIDRGRIIIDADAADRGLIIGFSGNGDGIRAQVRNLTVTNARVEGNGAGILNYADTMLKNVVLTDNHAVGEFEGGGVLSFGGSLQVIDSLVSNNMSGSAGSGIASSSANLTVLRTTVDGNGTLHSSSEDPFVFGGGVFVSNSTATIERSTISNNRGYRGGGIGVLGSTVQIDNTTISGNQAFISAGLEFSNADTVIRNSTITENQLVGTIASYGAFNNGFGELDLGNTIVYGNRDHRGDPSDGQNSGTGAVIRSLGGNLFGSDTPFSGDAATYLPDSSDLIGADPKLGPLADNGGPTLTHLLYPDSPAIDAGNEDFMPLTDQRGRALVDVPDPVNGGSTIPDIGAYEVQRVDNGRFSYHTEGSQFGEGPALTYGFGFDDGRGSRTVDPNPKFLGAKWDTGPLTYGGIEEGLAGDKYGGQLFVDFSGRLGFDLGFYINSGTVDVGYEGNVNYAIDVAPDSSRAMVSAFVDIDDGYLTTISPKIGGYLDLIIDVDADVEATGCFIGCVSADLIDVHVDEKFELLAVNRQLEDDFGRPFFLDDFGEAMSRDRNTGIFYDLDNVPLGTLSDVGPVIPLFDGDVRYLELPIQEIAEGVIKAAKTAREKIKEIKEDRRVANELDEATKERDKADSELTRQNDELKKSEDRLRNEKTAGDYLRVKELAGEEYATAVRDGKELPAKGGTIREAEDALIDKERKKRNAQEAVEKRSKDKAEKNKKKSRFKTSGLGLILDVGAADGPLLGAQLGLSVGANISTPLGDIGVSRSIGSLQATLPDVNLTDSVPDADGRLSATTDSFVEHSDRDERRQLAKATVDLAALIPGFPGGKFNVTAGPLSLDVTTISYEIGPQLNVTQDVSAEPVMTTNGISYSFFDINDNPISTTVTVNGQPYANGLPVSRVDFSRGDQVVIDGVSYDGVVGNDVIVVQSALVMGTRFSNDIGLDVELEGSLEALALKLSAFDVDIANVGPLFRDRHTAAEFDIGSVFRKTFSLPDRTVSLGEFRLFEMVSDGRTLDTALMTHPTGEPDEASVTIDNVRTVAPTFITTEMTEPGNNEEFFTTLRINVQGSSDIGGLPEVLDERLTVTQGSVIGEFFITGFTENMINNRSSAVFALRFSDAGDATITVTRSNPQTRAALLRDTEVEVTADDDNFDQLGVRAVLTNDIDDNGRVDPETDGKLLIRRLAGFSGDALIADALGTGARRTDPAEIADFIDNLLNTRFRDDDGTTGETLDIDDSGESASALGDGILLTRYMTGARGTELSRDVLAQTALRTDPAELLAWIEYGRSTADIENADGDEETDGFNDAIDRTGGDPLGLAGAADPDPSAVPGSSAYVGVPGTAGTTPERRDYTLSGFGLSVDFTESYFDSIAPENFASLKAEGSPASFSNRSRQHLIASGGSEQNLVMQTVPQILGVDQPLFLETRDAATMEFTTEPGYAMSSVTVHPRVGGHLYLSSLYDIFVFNEAGSSWDFVGTISGADEAQQMRDGSLQLMLAEPVSRIRLHSYAFRNEELLDENNTEAPELNVTFGFTFAAESGAGGVPVVERRIIDERTPLSESDHVDFTYPTTASTTMPVTTTFDVRRFVSDIVVDAEATAPPRVEPQDTFDIANMRSLTISGNDLSDDTIRLHIDGGPLLTPITVRAGYGFDVLSAPGSETVLDLTERSDRQELTDTQATAAALTVTDLELIDLRGTGSNTLIVDAQAVINNDSLHHVLTVRRDSDDSIILADSGWEPNGLTTVDGTDFEILVNGRATLLLEQLPASQHAGADGSQPNVIFADPEPSSPAVQLRVGRSGGNQPSASSSAPSVVAPNSAATAARIDVASAASFARAESSASLDVLWTPEGGGMVDSAGLNLRIHYDSSQLSFRDTDSLFAAGFSVLQDVEEASVEHDDGNEATDRVLKVLWYDLDARWPGVAAGSVLLTVNFDTTSEFTQTEVFLAADTTADEALPVVSSVFAVPVKPVVTSPTGSTSAHRPQFTWTETAGASTYEIWLSNLSTGESPYLREFVSTTEFTPSSDLPIGRYRFWVNARGNGLQSGYSTPVTFTLNGSPQITAPQLTSTSGTPVLEWDTVPGADSYDLWINDTERSVSRVYRNTDITGTSQEISAGLELGRHTAWVRAITDAGFVSSWSPAFQFDIGTAPVVSDLFRGTFDSTPAMNWSSVPGADTYDLWVRNLTTGQDQIIREQSLATTSYVVPAPLPTGDYRIWVQAQTSGGYQGRWSAPVDLHVGGRTEITGPTGNISNNRPTIVWRAVEGADRYDLWVDRIGGPSQLIRTTVTGTEFTPAIPLPGGTYRVWVKAISTSGVHGPWSPFRQFTLS